LYEVHAEDLLKLDNDEQGYRRRRARVLLRNGRAAKAWIYVSAPDERNESLRPYTWYKRFLVEGAKEHRLPKGYVATLEGVVAIQDPNQERDAWKRNLTCP
jgi:hypothetical protein